MWYFIIWAMLANGEVIKEEYDGFLTLENCRIIREYQAAQMKELGEGFIVTRCKRDTSKETY